MKEKTKKLISGQTALQKKPIIEQNKRAIENMSKLNKEIKSSRKINGTSKSPLRAVSGKKS